MFMTTGEWVQTTLLAGILGSEIDKTRLQQRQLALFQRQKDLQVMAAKYPAVDQITLEQWLDQYYLWKFGPKKSWIQGPIFRVVLPILMAGVVFLIGAFRVLVTLSPGVSTDAINSAIGTALITTFWTAVVALVVFNIFGAYMAKERRDNWPRKPRATPEIYGTGLTGIEG